MFFLHLITKRLPAILIVVFMTANSMADTTNVPEQNNSARSDTELLDVYKRATCGCCGKWITHMQTQGFQTAAHDIDDLSSLKIEKGIKPRYHSCHTAITQDGYVFEGHIPAKYIKKFLTEKPEDAIGLAVPAMPIGSPGMEMGNRFMPYAVLLLKKDGSSEIYARVRSLKEQYQ